MKKEVCKKIISMAALLILWSYPQIPLYVRAKETIFTIIFLIAVIVIYTVKNKGAAFGIVVALSVGACIYSFEYLTTYVSALLLIAAHRYLSFGVADGKKDKTGISGIYITFSYMATAVNFIYGFMTVKTHEEITVSLKTSLSIHTLWIFAVFVLLLVISYNNQVKKNEKERLITLRRLYISAIVGYIASYCTYTLSGSVYIYEEVRISFTPWFVLLVLMCLDEDPVLKQLIKKVEKIIVS